MVYELVVILTIIRSIIWLSRVLFRVIHWISTYLSSSLLMLCNIILLNNRFKSAFFNIFINELFFNHFYLFQLIFSPSFASLKDVNLTWTRFTSHSICRVIYGSLRINLWLKSTGTFFLFFHFLICLSQYFHIFFLF